MTLIDTAEAYSSGEVSEVSEVSDFLSPLRACGLVDW
jgi:hypothetical protein